MQLKVVEMTSYEKMIHILHNKDFELLEDWVADDYFFVFESQMWTRDEFLERMKDFFQQVRRLPILCLKKNVCLRMKTA